MELALASSIHGLLSLSTETFLPLLASLTCHQSPAQLKRLFLSLPLSYHLIQESTALHTGCEKGLVPNKAALGRL